MLRRSQIRVLFRIYPDDFFSPRISARICASTATIALMLTMRRLDEDGVYRFALAA